MLAKAILVHGVIGYKFCWLLPFENHNQGIPAGHESAKTPIGNESMVILLFPFGTKKGDTFKAFNFFWILDVDDDYCYFVNMLILDILIHMLI